MAATVAQAVILSRGFYNAGTWPVLSAALDGVLNFQLVRVAKALCGISATNPDHNTMVEIQCLEGIDKVPRDAIP